MDAALVSYCLRNNVSLEEVADAIIRASRKTGMAADAVDAAFLRGITAQMGTERPKTPSYPNEGLRPA